MARLTVRTIEKLQSRNIKAVDKQPVEGDISHKRTFVSAERHTKITVDKLAERFCIGPLKAKETLNVTTQRGLKSAILPLSRKYRTDRMFGVKRLNGKFATDSLYLKKRL